jgi:hypothetical protein
VDGLVLLSDFLQLDNISTRSTRLSCSDDACDVDAAAHSYIGSMDTAIRHVQSTVELCTTTPVFFERNTLSQSYGDIPPIYSHPVESTDSDGTFPELSAGLSSAYLSETVHNTLYKLQSKRDEAQSKYMALKVLHRHDTSMHRMKREALKSELQSIKKYNAQTISNNYFIGDQDWRGPRSVHQQMQSHNDDDLMELCKQLSGEISARGAVSLEVNRLKQSIEVERAANMKQYKRMQEEIDTLKKKLSDAESLAVKYNEEARNWKSLVESASNRDISYDSHSRGSEM